MQDQSAAAMMVEIGTALAAAQVAEAALVEPVYLLNPAPSSTMTCCVLFRCWSQRRYRSA